MSTKPSPSSKKSTKSTPPAASVSLEGAPAARARPKLLAPVAGASQASAALPKQSPAVGVAPSALSSERLLDPVGSETFAPRKIRPVPAPMPQAQDVDARANKPASPSIVRATPQEIPETFSTSSAPVQAPSYLAAPHDPTEPLRTERGRQPLTPMRDLGAQAQPALSQASVMGGILRRTDSIPGASAPMASSHNMAKRLEMSHLARETLATPMASSPSAPALSPRPAPVGAQGIARMKDIALVEADKTPALTTRRSIERKPAKDPLVSGAHPAVVARNAMLGLALSFFEDFQSHILGPVAALWRHRGAFISAMLHVMVPFVLTYAFAHWNPYMQAIFLEGGVVSNIGKLCWLFVVSSFVWTLIFILGLRVLQTFKFDWARFERIGRGFMSPHNSND